MKITVILETFIPTPYETYNHFYKAVPIEIPEDGIEWHVCGEMIESADRVDMTFINGKGLE